MFTTLFVTLIIKTPIAFALGFSCLVYLLHSGTPLALLGQHFIIMMDSFTLLAIPFFVLAGEFMSRGGIMRRLIKFSEVIVGHVAGGLAHVNVVTSMILAGMSGSAVSDAAMTSRILVPEMEREGYPRAYAAAVTGGSATIGPIIPPSIPMVIVGVMNELSIGRLFLGGAVPGFLIGIGMMILIMFQAKKRSFPKRDKRSSFPEIFKATKEAIPAFSLPIIILGGMLTGLVTATEAALLGAYAALIVSVFVYRELTWKGFMESILDSVKTSANLMLIVGFAGIFGWILTAEQFAARFGDLILLITDNRYVVLLLLNILMLFMGLFINVTPNIILLSPVVFPLIQKFGIDPIHFGVVMVMNIMIGQLTPPVGVVSFAVVDAAKVKFDKYLKELVPFLIVLVITLLIVTYIPSLVLWLPNMVFK